MPMEILPEKSSLVTAVTTVRKDSCLTVSYRRSSVTSNWKRKKCYNGSRRHLDFKKI